MVARHGHRAVHGRSDERWRVGAHAVWLAEWAFRDRRHVLALVGHAENFQQALRGYDVHILGRQDHCDRAVSAAAIIKRGAADRSLVFGRLFERPAACLCITRESFAGSGGRRADDRRVILSRARAFKGLR